MGVSEIIRRARTDAGLSQSELARLTGIRQPSLSAFESGKVEPRPETVARILDATRLRPSVLLQRHRSEVLDAVRRRHASNVRVFGSVAREEDTPASDIDFLVTFDENASLLDAAGLLLDLEALLGVSVDVMSDRSEGLIHDRAVAQAIPL
jgi:predicted nucleotidyltransferase